VALAFCPATAGLFFGVLIPLGVAHQSPVMYAVCFGVGYGAPLGVIATSLAYGARLEFIRSHADKWTRLSGWVLIALGTMFMFRIT
jgi:cytochrome c-type biogenesis protein